MHLSPQRSMIFLALSVCFPRAASAAPVSFGPYTQFATGDTPYSVAIADLNGDGKPDLAVGNNNVLQAEPNTVSVLLGNGAGGFGPKADFVARRARAVAIADLNADLKPDLAVTSGDGGDPGLLSVLLGNGDGTFGPTTESVIGRGPDDLAIADLNGDLKPDLAVPNLYSNTVSVLLGNGAGGFGANTEFATGEFPHGVAIGDLNGDLKPDLAVANHLASTVSVLLGNGDGTFGLKADFVTGGGPHDVAIGDLNADLKPDLAVTNHFPSTVSVLLGNGAGGFGAKADFETGAGPVGVQIADLNCDLKPDLAVANFYVATGVSVLVGNGDGTFLPKADFATGIDGGLSVAIADLNADLKPDLVKANYREASVSVLLNTCGQTVPVEVSDLRALASPDGIAVDWRLAEEARSHLAGVHVERALDTAGPYERRTVEPLAPEAAMRFEDRAVEPGRMYWYRLVLLESDGVVSIAGPVSVTSGRHLRAGLVRVAQSRTTRDVRIVFGTSDANFKGDLAVFDSAGRRVWSTSVTAGAAGEHEIAWDERGPSGRRVARGVYSVRMQGLGITSTRKLVLLAR